MTEIIQNPLRIALASCAVLPEPDTDFEPLAAALRARGCEVDAFPWDGPGDLSNFDVCVLRSTWNYYHQPVQFLNWIDAAARQCQLINSASVVRWNADKRYLLELQNEGVPIVETVWFDAGQPAESIAEICSNRNWSRFVIKPVVSAASFCTRSFAGGDLPAAVEFLTAQLPTRAMMAQPFMESITTVGEKSIAWIDGQITHAWTKWPRFAGQHENVRPNAEITDGDREIVDQAVRGSRDQVLYARIDLMYDTNGTPQLSELELIEPSLYFNFSHSALERFVNGILRRAGHSAGKAG